MRKMTFRNIKVYSLIYVMMYTHINILKSIYFWILQFARGIRFDMDMETDACDKSKNKNFWTAAGPGEDS